MRFRPAGGLDLATGALILGGSCLVAISIVAAVVLLAPPPAVTPPAPVATTGRAAVALPAGRVAAVLNADVSAGAGTAARSGDRVDVLAYFSHQVTGAEAVTRVLVNDVEVLTVDRSGSNVALTLAVPQASALLLQEAQALGARPFVALRSVDGTTDMPSSFGDADLAHRFTGGR